MASANVSLGQLDRSWQLAEGGILRKKIALVAAPVALLIGMGVVAAQAAQAAPAPTITNKVKAHPDGIKWT